jgi:D-alanine-D-alanine ligase
MTSSTASKAERNFRVALLVNLASNAPLLHDDAPEDALVELDSESSAAAYVEALRDAGHEVSMHDGGPQMTADVQAFAPDICFNTCEGYRGDSREAHVPALLEMIGARYTGPTPLAAAVTNDKPTTKRVLHYYGLPTPLFQVFTTPDEPLHPSLCFPLFVKPAHEGTGMGIGNRSLVHDEAALRDSAAWMIEKYQQPALVESYIAGRDITCGLVGNGDDVHFFPISEADLSGYPADLVPVYGTAQKNTLEHLYRYHCPASLDDALASEVRRLTLQTFRVTGCRDYARVDFRLQDDGKLFILEINGLPGITPRSDLTLMARVQGWTHGDLVRSVLNAGLKRYGLR